MERTRRIPNLFTVCFGLALTVLLSASPRAAARDGRDGRVGVCLSPACA